MFKKVEALVESSLFQNFIIGIIVLNGITMGLETSKTIMSSYSSFILTFDKIVVAIFTLEIVLRIYVHRVSLF